MIKMKMTMEKSKKNEKQKKKLKQMKMMKSWENQAAHKSVAIVEL